MCLVIVVTFSLSLLTDALKLSLAKWRNRLSVLHDLIETCLHVRLIAA